MELVKRNQKLHNLDSPLLIGDVKDGDVVKEVRNIVSLKLTKSSTTYAYFQSTLYKYFELIFMKRKSSY